LIDLLRIRSVGRPKRQLTFDAGRDDNGRSATNPNPASAANTSDGETPTTFSNSET